MQETLLIVLAVAVVFYFLYSYKKRKEKQMGENIESMIEVGDWNGVCRILRKQLIIWGVVLALVVFAVVYDIAAMGRMPYAKMILAVLVIWRYYKLVDMYRTSRYNEKILSEQERGQESQESEQEADR